MRVLIVPDKFKGTLTAHQAVRAIARGWKRARPGDRLDLLPMSDGGDGFGRVLGDLLGARRMRIQTVDAAHRPRQAAWYWEPHTRTALIESAEVIGLALLSPGSFHPFDLDTAGLGRLLAAVSNQQPRRCLVGIGGSATNDGGFGMARALGWQFLDRHAREVRQWVDLAQCKSVVPAPQPVSLGRVTVAVDVANPLLGPEGCTRVYGPQKGLRPRDFTRAERSLRQLAAVVESRLHRDLASEAGAGAAGGLGFGLMAFVTARTESGFDLFAELSRLHDRIRRADLVVTGEGALDTQSLMGKGVGRIVRACRTAEVPCLALAGVVDLRGPTHQWLKGCRALAPDFVSGEEALNRPALHLARLAAQVAANRLWT